MCQNVRVTIRCLRKTTQTSRNRASERSLSCMCSHVCLQIGLISERFPAIFERTTEWFFSGVNKKVTFQFCSFVETFVTTSVVTHKLFLSVCQKMLAKNFSIVYHFGTPRMKTTKSRLSSSRSNFCGMRTPFVLCRVSTILS